MKTTIEAFIISQKEPIKVEADIDVDMIEEVIYDEQLQLWVFNGTREPVVSSNTVEYTRCSRFGETTITRTSGEGADQAEISEPQKEKPSGNHVKKSWLTLRTSRFGETTLTETREGVDQSEVTEWIGSEKENQSLKSCC